MTFDERIAYEEGQEAAVAFCELAPEVLAAIRDGHLSRALDLIALGVLGKAEVTPQMGTALRALSSTSARLGSFYDENGFVCETDDDTITELMLRGEKYITHVATHNDDSSPKALGLLAAVEAASDGLRVEAREAGIPEDDLTDDEVKPEDAYFGRGFIDAIAAKRRER